MARTNVAIFGLGASGQQLVADLASIGVGTFTLVDPGILDDANIGTTSIRAYDVGTPKVTVAREAIWAINPDADIVAYRMRDCDLPSDAIDELFHDASIVLSLTDDSRAALRLNGHGIQHNVDVIHAGTHPGNRSFEILGTLAEPDRNYCYRCIAPSRCDGLEDQAPLDSDSPSFPTFRTASGLRNSTLGFVVLGLLHWRAGSTRPIAAWGEAFAAAPHWIGAMAPDAFRTAGGLFADVPGDLSFGVRPFREAHASGWVCPACGHVAP